MNGAPKSGFGRWLMQGSKTVVTSVSAAMTDAELRAELAKMLVECDARPDQNVTLSAGVLGAMLRVLLATERAQ